MVNSKHWIEAAAQSTFKAYPATPEANRSLELVSFNAPSSRTPKRAFYIGQSIPCDDGTYVSKCGRWRVEVAASRVCVVERISGEDDWAYWYKSRPGRLW